MRTGYIGLGNIGAPMAHRLAMAGDCLVHDALEAAAASFADSARWCATPRLMGETADYVGICVRDDADVRAVVDGPDGLLQTMRSGVIAVHSTVEPATVIALASRAAALGVTLIDAAVTGGADAAAKGELVIMAGGGEDAVEMATPGLLNYSNKIIHAGATGAGMALKICNNLVTYVELAAALEAYRLADALGLDPACLTETMKANGNLTPFMEKFVAFRAAGPEMIGAQGFRASQAALVTLGCKDLGLADKIAGANGPALTTARHVSTHFESIIMEDVEA
ncbi:MAG: NAD(P)-dependent oxidoreductase [Rhizorhabdus sp.]